MITPPTEEQRREILSSLRVNCAERPTCTCGRHYEDCHDADTHDTRTLCDGRRVTLTVTWIDRGRAELDIGMDLDNFRNYEIEDMLSKRIGGAWIVCGRCPYNGVFCSSKGNEGP